MSMTTSTAMAAFIVAQYRAIQARGGHAAIDYGNGELALMCSRPLNGGPETWGRGAVPQTFTDAWIRLVEC